MPTPFASSRSVAEHEGRLPQPGVPSGPRNTPSASAHYHGDLSIPGYQPSTPTTAPPPGEAATGPAGDYAGAHRAYTRAVAALPPPAQLAPPVAPPSTLASILGPLGAVLGVNPSVASAAGATLADLLSPDAQQQPPGLADAVAVKEAPKNPVDPRDPLGSKTLGDVTAAQLARTGRAGTLHLSPNGTLTTPPGRRAVADILAAHQKVDATSGIAGITDGPAATMFAEELAKQTHLDPRAVGAWVQTEGAGETGGTGGEAGRNNWLGVGYPAHRTPFSESPHFNRGPRAAADATAAWMEGKIGGNYGYQASPGIQSIIPTAAGKGPRAFLGALSASGWGTNVSDVASNLPGIRASDPAPEAVKALQVAKHNARGLGINPTPFNGDVEGGGAKTVFVRADAQGMVQWVKSALGTTEGTPKQLRWAANEGLSGSQPWCANFVSNGLARRGVPLPPNPNYVPSYESEWTGGRNIGTNLSKAKPGDLIAYSGDHIAVYVGNGKVVSGNYGNEVAESNAAEGPAPVSAILRPNYQGGRVAVHEAQVPGSTAAGAFSGPEGVAGATPASGGGVGSPTGRPAMAPTQLATISSPLAAGPVMPSDLLSVPESEAHGSHALETIEALLGETPATPTGRPRLG